MKKEHENPHHKTPAHSWWGFAFGGILLLTSIVNMFVLKEPVVHPLSFYVTLIPGILFMFYSMRPHFGVLRGITMYLGGTLLGVMPMALTSNNDKVMGLSLIGALAGAALLGISLSVKPEHITT